MISQRIIEGTGEEIAKYTQKHPHDRFKLIVLAAVERPNEYGPGSEGWGKMMEFRRSMKAKLGPLPLEATSTEALYD